MIRSRSGGRSLLVLAALLAACGETDVSVVEVEAAASTGGIGPAPTSLTSVPTSSSSVEPTASMGTNTSADAATTTLATPQLARPIIDVDWCRPTLAGTRDGALEGAYLWARLDGLPIQVFVPAGGSVSGQFAVSVRVTANLRFIADWANTEVNGRPARITFSKLTRGELLWPLPDGSEAYLRTSTMTSDELIALAATLEARPLTDTLPGFDTTSAAYDLSAEAITPIPIDTIVETACSTEDGAWMTATVIEGTLIQGLFLTDRPAVPLATRELTNGRLLVVTGREDIADRSQEVLDSVRDTTDDEWAALTAADASAFEQATDEQAGE